MNVEEMMHHVDHTQLKPFASWADIKQLCEEAITYQTASVCVPLSYVKSIHDTYGDQINIGTVVGFPLGYSNTAGKLAETKQALADGANEIDMVINIGAVKNGELDKVAAEIAAVKEVVGSRILKVIIETCYLMEEEKISLCQVVTRAGADYIKTSTGFGTSGATLSDIELFKKHIGAGVKIKAAGGVKSLSDLEQFIAAGCERIGTSSAVAFIKNQKSDGY